MAGKLNVEELKRENLHSHTTVYLISSAIINFEGLLEKRKQSQKIIDVDTYYLIPTARGVAIFSKEMVDKKIVVKAGREPYVRVPNIISTDDFEEIAVADFTTISREELLKLKSRLYYQPAPTHPITPLSSATSSAALAIGKAGVPAVSVAAENILRPVYKPLMSTKPAHPWKSHTSIPEKKFAKLSSGVGCGVSCRTPSAIGIETKSEQKIIYPSYSHTAASVPLFGSIWLEECIEKLRENPKKERQIEIAREYDVQCKTIGLNSLCVLIQHSTAYPENTSSDRILQLLQLLIMRIGIDPNKATGPEGSPFKIAEELTATCLKDYMLTTFALATVVASVRETMKPTVRLK